MSEGCPVSVCVLEENFSLLHKSGAPVSLCTHLQDQGLAVNKDVGTTKQS